MTWLLERKANKTMHSTLFIIPLLVILMLCGKEVRGMRQDYTLLDRDPVTTSTDAMDMEEADAITKMIIDETKAKV